MWFGNIETFILSEEFQVKTEFWYEVEVVSIFVIFFPFNDSTATSNPLPEVLVSSKVNLSPTLNLSPALWISKDSIGPEVTETTFIFCSKTSLISFTKS